MKTWAKTIQHLERAADSNNIATMNLVLSDAKDLDTTGKSDDAIEQLNDRIENLEMKIRNYYR